MDGDERTVILIARLQAKLRDALLELLVIKLGVLDGTNLCFIGFVPVPAIFHCVRFITRHLYRPGLGPLRRRSSASRQERPLFLGELELLVPVESPLLGAHDLRKHLQGVHILMIRSVGIIRGQTNTRAHFRGIVR